jgi:hypothetical protein
LRRRARRVQNGPVHSGIEIQAGFNPLVFTMAACHVMCVLDGARSILSWGSNFSYVTPGVHHLAVWIEGIGSGYHSQVQVDVPPGMIVGYSYYFEYPIFGIVTPMQLKLLGTRPMPAM